MTITLDDYQSLVRKVDKLKRLHNEATGAKKQLLLRLKQEHGVSDLKKALLLFKRLKKEEYEMSQVYTKAKIRFEKKWASKLKGLDYNGENVSKSGGI